LPSDQGPRVTVLTPTFNRAGLLPRAYASLVAQTHQDFEWLIVDDGSQDETRDRINEWARKSPFPLRYAWQENGGKHVAVNHGVRLALGRLVLILDSDDWLVPEAVERVVYWWGTIPEAEQGRFAGVAGLCMSPSGEVIGTRFPHEVLDSDSVEIRVRHRVRGDKCEVWRTDVLREYPFPEDLGRFVTEGLVWNRIARRYKVRFVNEVWKITEYQHDGLSAKSLELRAGSPRAAMVYYKEFAETSEVKIPILRRLREYANYTRFSCHARVSLLQQLHTARFKGLWCVASPVGVLLYLRDRARLRPSQRGKG